MNDQQTNIKDPFFKSCKHNNSVDLPLKTPARSNQLIIEALNNHLVASRIEACDHIPRFKIHAILPAPLIFSLDILFQQFILVLSNLLYRLNLILLFFSVAAAIVFDLTRPDTFKSVDKVCSYLSLIIIKLNYFERAVLVAKTVMAYYNYVIMI